MAGNSLLPELSGLLDDHTCEQAAAILCARHGLEREPPTTPWTCLFSPPADGPILELGAGFGDDSLRMAEAASRVIGAVPDQAGAQMLARRLAEADSAGVQVAIIDDLAHLPVTSGSLAGIGFAHAAEAGFDFTRQALPGIAREFARVMAPGGAVLIGLPTGLGSLIRRCLTRLSDGPGRWTFNRAIKFRPGGQSATRPSPRMVMTELVSVGFEVETYCAPLPSQERPAYLVPLDDPGAVGYFMSSLVRRDTLMTRGVAWLAGQRRVLERIQHLVPYCYLSLRARPGSRGGA